MRLLIFVDRDVARRPHAARERHAMFVSRAPARSTPTGPTFRNWAAWAVDGASGAALEGTQETDGYHARGADTWCATGTGNSAHAAHSASRYK